MTASSNCTAGHRAGRGRPTVIHADGLCAGDPGRAVISQRVAGLDPFYRNVVIAQEEPSAGLFPWVDVEPYRNPRNFRVPPALELAHRLVSRHGMPAAAVSHFAAGGAALLPVLGLLDIPMIVLLAESDLFPQGDTSTLGAIIDYGTLFLCPSESLRRRAVGQGCCPGRTFVYAEGRGDQRLRGRHLAARIEHAVELYRQRDMPLTSLVPRLWSGIRLEAWKTRRWKGGLKALQGTPAVPDELWQRYAGSHRKGIAGLVRLWKRLTYAAVLRPVVTMITDILGRLHEEADHDDLWFVKDVLMHDIELARVLAEQQDPRSRRAGSPRELTMGRVACADCPHCRPDALWPPRPCPLDEQCLQSLQSEFGSAALDADTVIQWPDGLQNRFAVWLGERAADITAACDGVLPAGLKDLAESCLQFRDNRLDADDACISALAGCFSGADKPALHRRLSEVERVLARRGRAALWISPLGMCARGGQALGLQSPLPFAGLIFGPDLFGSMSQGRIEPERLAGASDLHAMIDRSGLSLVCWQPYYDPALPATLIARLWPLLDRCKARDLMTCAAFCVLEKPEVPRNGQHVERHGPTSHVPPRGESPAVDSKP